MFSGRGRGVVSNAPVSTVSMKRISATMMCQESPIAVMAMSLGRYSLLPSGMASITALVVRCSFFSVPNKTSCNKNSACSTVMDFMGLISWLLWAGGNDQRDHGQTATRSADYTPSMHGGELGYSSGGACVGRRGL